jgi:hypothetical protein
MTQPLAEGENQYAWCADYILDLGTNCGFVSLEQCLATINGLGGQCYPNAQYRAEDRAADQSGS